MKANYVNELADGMKVDAPFALRAKEVRAARTGDAYLALELADRTGQIPAVVFQPGAEATAIPAGSLVRIRGTVTSYRGTKRVSVESMRPAQSPDSGDFIATGVRDSDEVVSEFKALASSVREPALRSVLRAVFGDPEFFGRFARCPGSQSYHHAYLGGLIEHTVSVASLARTISEQHASIDRDLLLTAALLHDVGKCDELAFDTAIEYTDEGRLLGHVTLGVLRLREAVAKRHLRVPAERLLRLEHAVLSHHGELEWGSPKRPSTIEALALHHIDNLDAKATGFCELVGSASRVDEAWTDAANLFRRPLYAPQAAEDDRSQPVQEDGLHGRLSA